MNSRTPESSATNLRWTVNRPENTQYVIDGRVFYAYHNNTTTNPLADDDSIDIVVTSSPGVVVAMGFIARIGGTGQVDVFEGVTDVDGGTIFVPRNRNRVSEKTSQVGVIINPTSFTTNGVLYEEQIIGGTGFRATGATVSAEYAILRPDTSYLFRLFNRSRQARVAELYLQWFE